MTSEVNELLLTITHLLAQPHTCVTKHKLSTKHNKYIQITYICENGLVPACSFEDSHTEASSAAAFHKMCKLLYYGKETCHV